MRAARAAAGMTLLEVLAASALLSFFFVGVFGVVWSTVRTRDSIERAALPFATGPAVMDTVVRDLQNVQVEAFDPAKALFEGSSDRDEDVKLDFVTAVSSRERVEVKDGTARALVNEVGYRLRRSEVDRDLFALFRREDLSVDDSPTEGGKYYKLCDRVKRFAVEYFDEDPGEPGSEKAEGKLEWDHKQDGKLPWGCRVTLVLVGTEDERADEDAPPPEYAFQAYVAFRTRFDKPDGGGKPGR